MPARRCCVALAICFTVALHGASSFARELTFEDRVSAQEAIERVFWNHRIWPKENPQPKPQLAMVMSDEAIRLRVADYLKKSNALEIWWHRPLTGVNLQSEVARMARDTRDPDMLRELFGALGNDPVLIAETLGRQTIADRLIRSWYVNDSRFHGETRRQAESALSECDNVTCLQSRGGTSSEITRRLRDADRRRTTVDSSLATIDLDPAEWDEHRRRLASKLGGIAESLPQGRWSALEETADRFVVTRVLSQDAGALTVGTIEWPKLSFDTWWSGARRSLSSAVASVSTPFVLPRPNAAGCADDTWEPTAFDNPGGRYLHTAVWTGTEMIVWGGIDGVNLNTGGRYSPATDTWVPTSRGTNTPSARYSHTSVWTGTEMIVWGGMGPHFQNTGGRYDPSTDSWKATSTGANVPSARRSHVAVWTGSRMIIWGGGPSGSPDTGGRYDPATNSWTRLSIGSNAPASRSDASAVWTGTEMIVWGGNDGRYWNTGGRYNPSSNTWMPTSVGPNVPYYRSGHSAIWTGTEMIIWGGNVRDPNEQYFNTGGRYDPATDSWRATSTVGDVPAPRRDHTAVWDGNHMIVWGGSPGYRTAFNSGAQYDPAADSWTTISEAASVPDPRFLHTAIWTGTEMIVWGGLHANQDVSNTGGRYNPSSDTWVPTHRSSPDGRQLHSGLWTGVEMIVWGGLGPDHASGTGGNYRPATDTWSPTSVAANVPLPRYEHTAVWTGTEMIVWGGIGYDGNHDFENSGGRYSPSTDRWLPTSTGENVPSARASSTAVWTGTEMIVWGGLASHDTDSGGRYDPSTDTWLATSTGANVPASRSHHAAVWTGSEMIIWGGYHSGVFTEDFNTGGRYDPSTDTWLPTSTGANVPSPRGLHAAAWTGAEMIVWGGTSVFDGGRYDPSTDSWKTMSTEHDHSVSNVEFAAVWADPEFIVWGGWNPRNDGHDYTNRGGRYNPSTDTWTPTSISDNVPTRRSRLPAVWTGTEMIVWGGYGEGTSTTSELLGTGGRYCAVCAPVTWYRDLDADGYGDVLVTQTSCTLPAGFVIHAGDCNDANSAVHPGATELCNGADENCDDIVDNGGGALCSDTDACTADVCASTAGCLPGHMPVNLDDTGFSVGRVDGSDLEVLANAWNSCPGDPRYNPAANFDQGGSTPESCVDLTDFHFFMTAFAQSCS